MSEHQTSNPFPLTLEFMAMTSHAAAVENATLKTLEPCRVETSKEFFHTDPNCATDAVRGALLNAAGIGAWKSETPHRVRSGDRIALTMQAGDIFAVLAFPNIFASAAEPIDFWQAHADGDLLELMGTNDPRYVSGLSDNDPNCSEDPVPRLDRKGTHPNAIINGRERLVPGDRLLWLRATSGDHDCRMVLFEMLNFCQVVGRTWEPRSDDGFPLQLNLPTYSALPESMVRMIRSAMKLGVPRSWAPRTEHDDFATGHGELPQDPEFWLPQLVSRRRGRQRNY